MTPRLRAIANLIKQDASIIDVGTDHAYIPIYLLKEEKAIKALATDVHDGPLQRAKQNIDLFKLGDRILLQKANGLVGIETAEYDTIIIAGMGGILISEIIEGASNLSNMQLILQPMTAAEELRRYLNNNGFFIQEESIVQEDKKLYVILKATQGTEIPYTDVELLLGRQSKKEELYPLLKQQVKEKIKKRFLGLSSANISDEKELDRLKNILQELSI